MDFYPRTSPPEEACESGELHQDNKDNTSINTIHNNNNQAITIMATTTTTEDNEDNNSFSTIHNNKKASKIMATTTTTLITHMQTNKQRNMFVDSCQSYPRSCLPEHKRYACVATTIRKPSWPNSLALHHKVSSNNNNKKGL